MLDLLVGLLESAAASRRRRAASAYARFRARARSWPFASPCFIPDASTGAAISGRSRRTPAPQVGRCGTGQEPAGMLGCRPNRHQKREDFHETYGISAISAAACAGVALVRRAGRRRKIQDRFDPADDRTAAIDRQAGSGGAKLWMAQHGDTVAGKKIELVIRDDGAVPDNTKRIAQDLLVNDKVNFLAGFGITPRRWRSRRSPPRPRRRKSSPPRAPRSSPRSRPISCARASRWRNPRCRWPIGRRRTASRRS